jgi:hypothetical protein
MVKSTIFEAYLRPSRTAGSATAMFQYVQYPKIKKETINLFLSIMQISIHTTSKELPEHQTLQIQKNQDLDKM